MSRNGSGSPLTNLRNKIGGAVDKIGGAVDKIGGAVDNVKSVAEVGVYALVGVRVGQHPLWVLLIHCQHAV
jgi:hypothetical protein